MVKIDFLLIRQVFTKFVQVGRAVFINYGKDVGKLAVIVGVMNDNRVLIDGEGISRQVIPIRRLSLTKFHLKETTTGLRSSGLRYSLIRSPPEK
jgi:large subunit ribosomal protein L14e